MIVDEVKKWNHDSHFFTIENSIPVAAIPSKIDLSSILPTIPYRFLNPSGISVFPGHIHKIVKYKGNLYALKSTNLPGDEYSLAQELRKYALVKGSKWVSRTSRDRSKTKQKRGYSNSVLFNYVHGLRIPLESIDKRSIEECFPWRIRNRRRSTYPWIEIDVLFDSQQSK